MVKRVLKSSVFNYIEFDVLSTRVKEEGLGWRHKHGGIGGQMMLKATDWMEAPRHGVVTDKRREESNHRLGK